jgi:CheY-like chemotaxis protein
MESAVEARVFDPFFSTKEAEDNRGLGMTTVYAIARKRGGDAELVSRPGQGTTVRLLLPIAKRAPTRTQSRGQAVAQCRGTILVVEDDALVRTSIRHYLRRAGYQVLEARTAADALRIYRNQSGEVDLVLTDVVLPGMSGPHLRRRLQQLLPKPPVVLVSAYPEEKLRQRPDFDPGASVLPKPFSEKQLLEAVEAELPVKRSA